MNAKHLYKCAIVVLDPWPLLSASRVHLERQSRFSHEGLITVEITAPPDVAVH